MNGVIVTNTDRDEAKTLLTDTWRNVQLYYESSLFRFVRRAYHDAKEIGRKNDRAKSWVEKCGHFFLAVSIVSRTTDKANERLLVANSIIFFIGYGYLFMEQHEI